MLPTGVREIADESNVELFADGIGIQMQNLSKESLVNVNGIIFAVTIESLTPR